MSGGVVLLSADQGRAVFLTGADLTMLEETLDVILNRPTVAGEPPDLDGLERLARAVELAREDNAPTVLSAIEESGLELIKNQAAIRANLPMRIRRTCRECGHEQIVNPARQARTAPQPQPQAGGSNAGVDTVATSMSLLSEGHPFLATLNLFSGGSAAGTSEPQQPVCGRCDGEDFGSDVVTICPGCRAFRDESILLACPECAFDFLSRRADDEFWVPPSQAAADAALAANVALLKETAAGFENNLWSGQLQALVATLRPDEQLFGMCRCGLPNQVGRYVALLLTSRQLAWARESPMSNATSGTVLWPDVLAIHPFPGTGAPNERGIHLEIRNSPPLVFNNFRGRGIRFGAEQTVFTADSVHAMVHQLWQPHQPAVVATAAPAAPQPAGSPGWYPDPWRMARTRWWNGDQWTAYLGP